jgi:hypothetical protein
MVCCYRKQILPIDGRTKTKRAKEASVWQGTSLLCGVLAACTTGINVLHATTTEAAAHYANPLAFLLVEGFSDFTDVISGLVRSREREHKYR